MLAITCPICRRRELISTRRINRIHPNSDGLLGIVRCNADHSLVHDFRNDRTTALPG